MSASIQVTELLTSRLRLDQVYIRGGSSLRHRWGHVRLPHAWGREDLPEGPPGHSGHRRSAPQNEKTAFKCFNWFATNRNPTAIYNKFSLIYLISIFIDSSHDSLKTSLLIIHKINRSHPSTHSLTHSLIYCKILLIVFIIEWFATQRDYSLQHWTSISILGLKWV